MAINFIDVMLAKKQAQGQAASIMAGAQQASTKANQAATQAEQDATKTASVLADAEAANEKSQEIAAEYDALKADIDATTRTAAEEIVDEKLANFTADAVTEVEVVEDNTATAKRRKLRSRKKNQAAAEAEIMKNYTSTGTNEDGAMTQKAITEAIKAVEDKVEALPTTGGNASIDVGDAQPGTIIVVGEDGTVTAGSVTEDDIIQLQLAAGTLTIKNSVGVTISYTGKSVTKLTSLGDIDHYKAWGGRKRCVVADDGSIVAFENQSGFADDGSKGQVMVYQPKVYYLRTPAKTTILSNGTRLDEETIILSSTKQNGLTVHPLFLDANGREVDYVLLSAYEGCAYDTSASAYNLTDTQTVDFTADKLSSIVGAKPISGETQELTIAAAQQLAQNRGTGWDILNLAAVSLNQLLMLIEFGAHNVQSAFARGCVDHSWVVDKNTAITTGSTRSLGSTSGRATSSVQLVNGTSTTFTEDGKCAISYRGMENPYGNIWQFIGGVTASNYYITYINGGTTHTVSFTMPTASNWISAFGYDNAATWLNIPIEAASTATSALPVGDQILPTYATSQVNHLAVGGANYSNLEAGPYFYNFRYSLNYHSYSRSARLMHIPTANSTIHNNNVTKWQQATAGSDFYD